MGHIIPKLNLNRNPELVDNYGLVCAKNIRLLPDGTIGPDTAEVDIKIQEELNKLLNDDYDETRKDETSKEYKIVGVIPYNTCFYLFVIYQPTANDLSTTLSYIIKYDEKTNDVEQCNCNWNSHYTDDNPTKINGLCNVTLRNEIILNIAEYYEGEIVDKIPFKSINLAYSDESDDESIYTFAPNVPITNITLDNYYFAQIKTGVYTFYIRYELKDNVYSNWFLASVPMYSAYFKTYNTVQGTVKGIDVNLDSDKGFILKVSHLNNVDNIKKFQLGFKASLIDGGIVARSWKKFDINTEYIYFDYSLEDIEELDVADLEKPTNQLYNVKNVTNFKNKLYFSNYIEEDFNPDLEDYVDVDITLKNHSTNVLYLVADGTTYKDIDINSNIITGVRQEDDPLQRDSIKDWFMNSVDNIITPRIFEQRFIGYFYTTADKFFYYGNGSKTETIEPGHYSEIEKLYIVIKITNNLNHTILVRTGEEWSFPTDEYISEWDDFRLDYNTNKLTIDNYEVVNLVYEKYILYQEHTLSEDDFKHYVVTIPMRIAGVITPEFNLNIATLLPYQGYNFYIHFVKNNGIVTNGYFIKYIYLDNNAIEDNTYTINNFVYPSFKFNKNLPDGYVGCFISMSHVKNQIVDLYRLHNNGISQQDGSSFTDNTIFTDNTQYSEAFDLDVLNIVGVEGEVFDLVGNSLGLGTYFPGSDPNNNKTFGTTGKFYHVNTSAKYINYLYDVVNDENIIYRATNIFSYKENDEYDNPNDLYLQGYICTLNKPIRAEYQQYISGNDFYFKDYDEDGNALTSYKLPLSKHWDDINQKYFETILNTKIVIFSNYNNNYVTIKETPRNAIKTYKNASDKDRTRSMYLYDSGNLYQIYSLDGAFKIKFTQVFKKENKYIIEFNNTIRSTGVLDEQINTRYYLDNTEYYNIPTIKGIIINMKAIGNAIIVHTEDSMFVFSGANTLSAQGGEQIQLKEGNVFESGIKEVFGSEYGFGGIQKHHHQISSENGYLFYDSDSNNMYVYQDNQQLSPISNSIKKLLKDVIDVELASDYYNDRFFIKLKYSNSNIVLSFNVKTKSFLSLHDVNFDYAFNSKTLCYFVKDNNIYRKEVVYNPTNASVQPLYDNKDIFPIYTNANKTLAKPYIDIICNSDYDNVKVLDYVSWICKKVNNPYREIQTNEFVETDDNSQLIKMNVAEEDEIDYPAQGILIYSNLTAKGTTYFKFNTVAELDAILKENRRLYAEQGLYDATQRQYGSLKPRDMPYFQLGHWNYNYFRNDLDNNDVTISGSYSDNKSLLYGNYFVVRLIFDVGVNFKLKDLMFAINNSYETRR